METLLNKISESGLDASSVSGEEAIIFWNHIRQHIATTPQEKAQSLIISAEYRNELKQPKTSIEELRSALEHLSLPNDAELILEVKNSLADRLVESGDYSGALQEYITSSTIAVDTSHIDAYVLAVLGMGNLCDAYGDHNRALRYYQKIDSIDHAISSRSLRLRYKLYMLACYIELNRTSAAQDLLKECSELAILVSDKVLAGQILLYQAKLFRRLGKHEQAIESLGNVQYTAGNIHSIWLSNMIRLELAHSLNESNKPHLANWVLERAQKKIRRYASPVLNLKLNTALGDIYEQQGDFQQALACQKRAFRIESDLMKQIPIGELGAAQLRRLSRFELQLKLILSELENRELKETTENQKHTVAKLQQDVFTDPLTSLHNRRWLDVKLKDLLLHDVPFALMVIDIDHFKSINDELSHLVGDKAIVNVSHELAAYFKFRGASSVRFGGEEFLVILERTTLEQATMHAENYRERIFKFGWQNILGERGLTVSIGITLHREGENTQRTFYRADKALYRAKANGRNQVCTE
ncbi:GGDEF domain-containing protein [Vibrio sp. Isolate25]|uniref:GGDEF domain-containing protein n=1 Tax=Vibrio TaxID=662 RepID=UPI001EFDD77A|nr:MULTISPECIES: GGDEF domain-containing protein [Vibrio]MCG9595236.1 GGDEF domain-containing protein [Vibrio sp. Isolate25]MCG9681504.1 GGDEF domain-containing protein [Vibrio sp. Isolate23]USD34592.1 GGDEF domain-containing protein [Vibrio sp. SCSIO 43186]USD47660.1 GGDEF domain-containing protein [Vibrio sp. SCSIO 43145]USD71717.1 GGDEF domain-containing protein [Vibrio sp. SCSIO 43139]